jgi:hypothetical protein
MVGPLRPQPDAGAVGKPKPATLGLFGRHPQPFSPPDPLNLAVVHHPAAIAQQNCDLAIALTAILPSQLDQISRELLFIVTAPRHLALC